MMLFKSNKLIILALLQLVLLRSSCHSVVAEGQKGSQKKSSRQGTPRKGFTKSKSSQSSPNIQKIGQKTGKISKGVEESNKVRQHSIMDTPTMSPTITRYPTTSPSSILHTATPTTTSPTFQPSQSPSKSPTTGPSSTPSIGPTRTPTNLPSSGPTQSYIETESPTLASTAFNESPSLFPTLNELPVSSTGSESGTASNAPMAGTRTGCTFANEDGTVTHFEEGAILGSYGSLINCINGPPRNYPCYCDSTAPDQRVCPYCQFEDALDRIICAPRYTEVSILQPNQTFVSCQCQVEVTRNSGWYDVQVSSNCPLYNSDSGSGNSVINTEEEKEDTVAPTSTPTTTSTDAPTPAPTTFITDAPTPAPTTFITDAPTFEPTSRATVSPTEMVLTYQPGNLTRYQQGMWLSEGLSVRLLAISGQPVWYENGEESGIPFHYRPDGADIFAETRQWNRGGYIYVSNSEIRDGGVFAITFNANGDVIDYQHLLRSSWNCNGGRTPWGTWLSAEEDFDYHKGQVYQVDPTGEREPAVITMGNTGGVWEATAYDIRKMETPRFFLTEDDEQGALIRWTPDVPNWDDPWSMLLGSGKTEYLYLRPDYANGNTNGTFHWITDENVARQNAKSFYPYTEGIEADLPYLYFVCKNDYRMFRLNLDDQTFDYISTRGGLFDGQPDQIRSVLQNDGSKMIYFSEDYGRTAGIHARDEDGNFYTILEGAEYSVETAGISFSPDGKRMYFAYQDDGWFFEVTRDDGQSFYGKTVNLKPKHEENPAKFRKAR